MPEQLNEEVKHHTRVVENLRNGEVVTPVVDPLLDDEVSRAQRCYFNQEPMPELPVTA